MDKSDAPCLTEADIRELADDLSFERGMDYYMHDAIQEPVRQGSELRGECYGSRSEPYQVRVLLGERGIVAAHCTCPRGGFCKHIVALLLNYIRRPDAFRDVPPLEAMLASLTRDDLVGLVETMVRREPSLLALVETRASMPAGSSVDVTTLRRQIWRALRHEDLSDAEEDLRDLLRMAGDLSQSEDWLGAGTVYQEVLGALATCYDAEMQAMDGEGALAAIADDCVDGLEECLDEVDQDLAMRQSWLAVLLEAGLADISLGGVGFASGASHVLIEQATEEEWPLLEKQLLEVVAGSDEWKREVLVDILVGWNDGHGRHDEASRIINEAGTTEQRMFLLARDGKPDDAVALAMERFTGRPGMMVSLAEVLVESGAAEAAVTLLTQLANSREPDPSYLEWLALHYRKNNDLEAALTWQRDSFMKRLQVEPFTALREIADRIGCWEDVRTGVLKELEKEKQIGPLIEIAVHEGDAVRALELQPIAAREGWGDYREEVARIAEKERPLQAIALYQGLAADAITQRQRQAYAHAAAFLRRAKMLSGRVGCGKEWQGYLAALRKEHLRLRALQDELNRAGL